MTRMPKSPAAGAAQDGKHGRPDAMRWKRRVAPGNGNRDRNALERLFKEVAVDPGVRGRKEIEVEV